MQKRSLIVLFTLSTISFGARAACVAGQMATLTKPVTVKNIDRKNGVTTTTTLMAPNVVHVISVDEKSGQIEVYSAQGLSGARINGLGKVAANDNILSCQNSN